MYDRILVALDGSPLAEQALPHAIAHAEHFGAELVLLRVLEPLRLRSGLSPVAIERTEERTRRLVQEYLESITARVEEQGVPVRAVTVEGRSHQEIIRFAESNQIDLIVISSRGASGLSRWLMGSVADRVVRGARMPVLLVQPRKQQP
jgi:nucleotide-binding universal stress UspA family protein